jgi:GH24 family phage-related lysozyme (muramidase)
MMVRTQITLESEVQKRARKRASEIGVSFAEYVRQIVESDLAQPQKRTDVSQIFNLGSSGGANIAKQKQPMIAEAFAATRKTRRGRA